MKPTLCSPSTPRRSSSCACTRPRSFPTAPATSTNTSWSNGRASCPRPSARRPCRSGSRATGPTTCCPRTIPPTIRRGRSSRAGEAMTGVSRRELLERATALVAGAAVLDQLPHALRVQGWIEDAYATPPNVVQQTMNGLVAFIVPGRDRYSRAQGTKTKTPGGIEAGTTAPLIRTLDRFLPGPLPLSATAATILNEVAATVDPASRRGKFASPFANLSVGKEARVFETIEGLQTESSGSIRFLVGNLPDLVAFIAYSRPLGRRLTKYAGVADGHKELKGYWQGRKAADPSA